MKFFVALVLAFLSASNISYAADFDENNPSTWNEGHKIAARFEYCLHVIEEICPKNLNKNVVGNPFADFDKKCPYFTDKLNLAAQLLDEGVSKEQAAQHTLLRIALGEDIARAKVMKKLDIPNTAYENCRNDVEKFLTDEYKPKFNLQSFGD